MNQTSDNTLQQSGKGRRIALIFVGVAITGCAAMAGFGLFEAKRTVQLDAASLGAGELREANTEMVKDNGEPSAETTTPAIAKPLAVAATDPRLLRTQPPVILAVKSPEARRMILEMQNAYRCQHNGNRKVNLDCIPGLTGDDVPDIQALCSSLKQSLRTLPDSCYVNAALPQVANPRTPSALMEVLYQDLSQRPNPIRLRTLFILAGIEGHPLAQNAMREMSTVLRTDFQQDWGRWEQAVTQTVAHEERGMRSVTCRARQ